MNPFEYTNPVKVIFGDHVLDRLPEIVKPIGQRVLIVSYADASAEPSPLIQRITTLLTDQGVSAHAFCEVTPNPDISIITRGVKLARELQVELIIGVGGGSAMDAAKAIAAGVLYPHDDMWRMVYSRHDNITACPPEKALPTVMIPTLPATGSEMNPGAVVSNSALNEKSYIWSNCLFPQVALMDPTLTYTLPAYQTACGAVDTVSHVLEIYINGQSDSTLLHHWQAGIMKTVIEHLPTALANPTDSHARTELMWSATCALNGWASPGDAWTPIHQVGHVLTSHHKVNHGTSLAVLMPAWMRIMSQVRPEPYERFARQVMGLCGSELQGEELIAAGIDRFEAFIRESGLPTRLSEVGLTLDDLPKVLAGVKKVSFSADGFLNCQPPVSEERIATILQAAF